MTYEQYLKEQGYSQSTIAGDLQQVDAFQRWCRRNRTTPTEIDHSGCLRYIKHLTRRGNAKRTINHKPQALRVHFRYLMQQGERTDDPIEGATVRGQARATNHHLLDADELEDLYYSFETQDIQDPYHRLTAKRGKTITGLVVYQGLPTTDLGNLKVEHLQLSKGKIYVPSTRRNNARELEFRPWQVMELLGYVNQVLPPLRE